MCSIVAILLTREHKFKPALIVAVGCLLPISLYATQVLRTSASTLPKVVGPAESERIAAINDSWDLLAAAPATLPPNTATLSRIHDLSGYDSLLHRDTVKLLHEIMGQDPAPPANGNMMFIKPSANPLLLAEAGVSEVWTRKPMEKLGVLPVEEDGLFKYRLPGPGRAFVERPDGTKVPAKISDEGLGSFKVECEGPGKLVVRDRAMPGWQVSTGGRTYEIPTGTWMEVPGVPDGPMSAQFSYRPSGVVPAFWISVFAWLALGALVLRFRKP